MRILVIVASRHGSTAEIGDAVAEVLRNRGHDVDRCSPEDAPSLDDVDAVVLGSAIYMSQWLEPARHYVSVHGEELRRLPVWMFSSGPVGPEERPAPSSARIHGQLEAVEPLDYQVFSGAVDRAALSLRERSIVRLVGAPDGDYRNWGAVGDWARAIADTLDAV